MDSAQVGALSKAQVAAMSASAVAAIGAAAIGSLSAAGVSGLSGADAAALSAAQFGALGSAVAELTTSALAGLSATQVGALSPGQVAALSASQLDALGAKGLPGLTGAAISGLSSAVVAGLSTAALNALSTSQIGALTSAQTAALTTTQISGLSPGNFGALNGDYLTSAQVGGLNAAEISSMSASEFAELVAPNVAALSSAAVKGLTTTELGSLTATQAGGFTTAQLAVMSSAQQAALNGAVNAGAASVLQDAAAQEVNGALSYAGMLQVLQDAAAGGMTAAKFAGLQALAKKLNASGGISTSAYVEQITDDVVDGNSANADWNGGASTATPLGDLTASSSQTQVDELIGKWFLGTDLPSIDMAATNGSNVPAQYEAVNLPLFGADGPSYQDVNQGNVGDCYFEAALAETAAQDPSAIASMIQENSNGTYSVDFQVDGQSDYVTVNDELPVMQDGYQAANGSTLEFDNSTTGWSPLIEKAYAQLMEQTDVTPGGDLGVNGDSYADISGGAGQGITLITGQTYNTYFLNAGESASSLGSLASTLQSAISAARTSCSAPAARPRPAIWSRTICSKCSASTPPRER